MNPELLMTSPILWWSLIALVYVAATLLAAPRWLWVPAAGLACAGLLGLTAPGTGTWVAAGLVLALPIAVAVIGPLRRLLLSRPVMAFYARAMPEISETERAALDAGTTWWDAALFTGSPDWKQLLEFPPARLSEAEQAFLDGPVERLCAMLEDWRVENVDRDLPPEAWKLIREEGFFGMVIPEEYGGKGFSQYGHAAVVMKIASRSISAALTVMIPNSVGPAKLLLKYGSETQKQYYVPRLACGEEIPCFALTSREAGSDAGALGDTGVVCRQEHEGRPDVLGIRINFDKRYITLAPVATLLGVAFRLQDPDGLLGEEKDLGITLALVPGDAPGVEKGARHDPNHMAFMNGPVRGRDVFVPLENIIGGREFAGKGWRMLMESLTDGRAISLPALSTAAAKTATCLAGAYARVREQFGVAIGDFEGVQETLGRLAGNTHAMDATRLVTLAALDQGHKPSVISAIVKYNMTERARRCVDDAVEVHGGAGVCLGPSNPLGQLQHFPNVGVTVEGHNILTRTLITFGQGAIRCHPHLLDELSAVQGQTEEKPLRAFDRAFTGHLGHGLSNALRALALGITDGHGSRVPAGVPRSLRRHYRRLNRAAASFAIITDLLLLAYRGELKRKEQLSGRMADALSQLYIASTVLKHHHDRGYPESDIEATHWAVEDALGNFHAAISGLSRNARPLLGWLIRRFAFPVGRRWQGAADARTRALAREISHDSKLRTQLGEGMYLPPADSDERIAVLDRAMRAMVETSRERRAIRKALRRGEIAAQADYGELLRTAVEAGVIDQDRVTRLEEAEALRIAAIEVDEFTNQDEELKASTARAS